MKETPARSITWYLNIHIGVQEKGHGPIPSLETRRKILAAKLYDRLQENVRSDTYRTPAEKVIA